MPSKAPRVYGATSLASNGWSAAEIAGHYDILTPQDTAAFVTVVCVGAIYAEVAMDASRPAMDDFIEVRPDASFPATPKVVVISVGGALASRLHCTIWTGPGRRAEGDCSIIRRNASGEYPAHRQAEAAVPYQPDCGVSADLRLDEHAATTLWSSNLLEAIYTRGLPPADTLLPFG